MGRLLNIVSPLHKRTERDYLGRMMDDKVRSMGKAKEYEFDYWDGDRRYGYGGYVYDGRWKAVAEKLIQIYEGTSQIQRMVIAREIYGGNSPSGGLA